jgi:hypothetical protein
MRESEGAGPGVILPISRSRADAWSHNPHADPDDVVLLVARMEQRCVGHLGLFPTRLRLAELDVLEKVFWMSALYVPESARNTAVGGLLLMRAASLGVNLAAVDSSEEAQKTFKAMGFTQPKASSYFQADFAQESNLLGLPLRALRRLLASRTTESLESLDRAIGALGSLTASVGVALNRLASSPSEPRWHARDLDGLPESLAPPPAGPVSFLRDRPLLEWMLEHPWTTTDPESAAPGFYFDDLRQGFEHRAVELIDRRNDRSVGFAILWFNAWRNRRELHVLDYFFTDEATSESERGEALLAIALERSRGIRANQIFVPELCAAALPKLGPLERFFERKERLTYYRPSPRSSLKSHVHEITPQYADGDIGFA